MKQREDVSPKFIWQLILDDASEAICSKYVSRYAWLRAKLKLVKKLAVQCPAEMSSQILEVFQDRSDDYELLQFEPDLSEATALAKLASAVEKTKKKCVAIVSASLKPEVASIADVYLQHGRRGNYWFGGVNPEAAVRSLV